MSADDSKNSARLGGYSGDSVKRFVEDATDCPYTPPDMEAVQAAGYFLLDLIMDVKGGRSVKKRFSEIGVKKLRQNKFRPYDAPIDSDEFDAVLQYVQGRVTYADARARLMELRPASERQAENWIAAIRPRAERVQSYLDKLSDTSYRK